MKKSNQDKKNEDKMDQSFEQRWCKFCIDTTRQELIFLPEMATYKRKRRFKCTICGHTSWLPGRRPSAESVY
ncbi:MAG: hypothetical protein DWQ18_03010 [Crenarchaeota archaeon]|nr:MAG: hypothetical protein DWQ17_05520 [Thermoproteota archaeon]RDJ33898.1 MAG: hypothetical protein DWQ18_03010 [Thermoproteota archaeon]RDJ36990.1 MAG: hypothetical protein DWQ13_07610 [Thermoproteota archaeon]RDJ37475.1 MAG: hypothetical protein DWQ19_03225 [Thermoproteota archaeon]